MLESLIPTSSTPASLDPEPVPGKPADVVLFIEENGGDWHAGRLTRAFEVRGVSVVVTTLRRCAFDTSSPTGLRIPGFDGTLPAGAFVRAISTGSLEEITFRLGILHALRESGVRVWNDARAIERCVDKSATTFLLHKAGIATPRTRTVETLPPADAYVGAAGRPLIYKPLFGSQGKGLLRVDSVSELPAPEAADNIYYLQDYVPSSSATFEDWRVLVTRRRVVAAMARRAGNWITNVHQGAAPIAHLPDPEMASLAQGALAAVGGDYAGVDLIRGADGRLLVLEVNSNPSWRGLQSVSDINIAETIVEDFLYAVAEHRRAHTAAQPCPA